MESADQGRTHNETTKRRIENHASGDTGNSSGTILVIDDDPQILELVKFYLNNAGFKVETAANGHAGLKLARTIRPNVITLDVMMPGMDGWTVLKQLKDDAELKDIPVLMLTTLDEQGLGYALGADDYLFKPIDLEAFIANIRKWVREKPPEPVLIVSDDADQRKSLRDALQRQGYKVSEAQSADLAMQCVHNTLPSIIVLDLMRPDIQPAELMQSLHDDERLKTIPVIVLTSDDNEDNPMLRTTSPMQKILLHNNLQMHQLIEQIQETLNTRESRHEAA
jgi:DNA-binding response OmpR family regulator